MDIIKNPIRKPLYLKYWYVFVGVLCVVLFVLFTKKYNNVTGFVLGESLMIDSVMRGELSVSIRGYGQLSSKEVYWVGAESDGRVERIMVRAGDNIEVGEIIVQLFNPSLVQELKDAELEFDAQQADMIANHIALENQLLDLQTEVDNAEVDYLIKKMDLDANNELMEKGTQMISRIAMERDGLITQQYLQRWETQQQRVIKSEESMHAQRAAQETRLLQTENKMNKKRAQVEALFVRANISGIIQEMDLELGQQVSSGENISRIARPDELIAEVQIPELQVNDIQTGMKVAVDTRTSIIKGLVSRIDPTVVDGSVLIEIELLGELPMEVRPDLNIEANIEVAFIRDTLYVDRPVFSRPFSSSTVYKMNEDGDIADRISIRYGQASTNTIEILEGVDIGDKLIVSDPSALGDNERILIR